jgi:type IV pilus assembly protein PilB
MTVAMADPLNIIAIEELKYITRINIKRAIATHSSIAAAIDRYYSVADSLNDVIGAYNQTAIEADSAKIAEGIAAEGADAPVVKLVNLIISQAVKARASDIHIEPDEQELRVRFRINGIMKEEASPPKNLQPEIISRIKVAANLDVSEKRLPQDGRLMIKVDGIDIDLRISTLPTVHGEKVVIRILDKRILNIGLDQLGFADDILNKWADLIRVKEGLILITGPTSSGKTTTLYSVLQEINSIEKNIITIEDPVEYSIPLINQVQINEKAGLTFTAALRSILRQNPDIIMLGEIRDADTAAMAIRSALTGHLVFSTLHTNDAPSSITRLIDMGIENYLAASALKGVLAQRLVRTNCPHCMEKYVPGQIQLKMAGLAGNDQFEFYHGTGCSSCRMTGYSGLTGIYELIPIDDTINEMIIKGESDYQIRRYAETLGYRPMFRAGLDKVRNAEISLEELLRVISIKESSAVPLPEIGQNVNV